MENKLGEVESNISFDEYKLAVKCRYKHGDRCLIIIAFFYILAGIIMGVYAPGSTYAKYIFIIFGSFILWLYLVSGKRIKSNYKLLQNNGENKNHYDFFDNYIFKNNETNTSKIYYDKINEIYEDSENIICFIEMNRILFLKKQDCTEQILEKLRDTITEEKKSKLKRHKRKGNIFFVLQSLGIVIVTILAINFGKAKPDYPYATYESFVRCAEGGYVDDVTVYKNRFTFKYTGYDKDKYYNVAIKGNKDELMGLLDELNIDWSNK